MSSLDLGPDRCGVTVEAIPPTSTDHAGLALTIPTGDGIIEQGLARLVTPVEALRLAAWLIDYALERVR